MSSLSSTSATPAEIPKSSRKHHNQGEKMKAFAKVRCYIDRHALLEGARGVVVAVSGGPDSVALLDMLVRLAAAARGRGPGAGQEIENDNDFRQSHASAANLQSFPGPRPPGPGPRV